MRFSYVERVVSVSYWRRDMVSRPIGTNGHTLCHATTHGLTRDNSSTMGNTVSGPTATRAGGALDSFVSELGSDIVYDKRYAPTRPTSQSSSNFNPCLKSWHIALSQDSQVRA